jgi:hypothetical protein
MSWGLPVRRRTRRGKLPIQERRQYGSSVKLAAPFIQLPIRFDAARLEAEVAALDDAAWRDHPQKFPGNTMLPLVAVNGDPEDEGYKGQMRPTPALERCPYLRQTLAAIGVTIGRTRLMRLAGQAEVTRHADHGYYWADRVRVHIPIKTQPSVRFECGDAAVNMAAGECWIFDTWRMHRVMNANDDMRIHLVCDTVGGGPFWNLVEAGHAQPAQRRADWAPRLIEYASGAAPALAFESVNLPDVMTPWEIEMRLSFLMGEAGQHPQMPAIRRACARLLREWRAAWARYGESEAGTPEYSRILSQFVAEAQAPSAQVRLPNEIVLFNILMSYVGRTALAAAPATAIKQVEYA